MTQAIGNISHTVGVTPSSELGSRAPYLRPQGPDQYAGPTTGNGGGNFLTNLFSGVINFFKGLFGGGNTTDNGTGTASEAQQDSTLQSETPAANPAPSNSGGGILGGMLDGLTNLVTGGRPALQYKKNDLLPLGKYVSTELGGFSGVQDIIYQSIASQSDRDALATKLETEINTDLNFYQSQAGLVVHNNIKQATNADKALPVVIGGRTKFVEFYPSRMNPEQIKTLTAKIELLPFLKDTASFNNMAGGNLNDVNGITMPKSILDTLSLSSAKVRGGNNLTDELKAVSGDSNAAEALSKKTLDALQTVLISHGSGTLDGTTNYSGGKPVINAEGLKAYLQTSPEELLGDVLISFSKQGNGSPSFPKTKELMTEVIKIQNALKASTLPGKDTDPVKLYSVVYGAKSAIVKKADPKPIDDALKSLKDEKTNKSLNDLVSQTGLPLELLAVVYEQYASQASGTNDYGLSETALKAKDLLKDPDALLDVKIVRNALSNCLKATGNTPSTR
jgi:hypothetical protein